MITVRYFYHFISTQYFQLNIYPFFLYLSLLQLSVRLYPALCSSAFIFTFSSFLSCRVFSTVCKEIQQFLSNIFRVKVCHVQNNPSNIRKKKNSVENISVSQRRQLTIANGDQEVFFLFL
jgi:hypothetical protein